MIDSILIAPLLESIGSYLKNPDIFQTPVKNLMKRRRIAIEEHFGVRFVSCDYFPPDLIWQDYSQLPAYLPKRSSWVVDVGANLGDWTVIAAKYYGASVISVEPVLSSYQLLRANINLNSIDSQVIPINCALSDSNSALSLICESKVGYAVALSERENTKSGCVLQSYPAETLDAIIQRIHPSSLDLLKVDAEGSEVSILRGAVDTILTYFPRLIIEVHSLQLRKQVLELLSNFGYSMDFEKINFTRFISVLYLSHKSTNSCLK